MQQLHLSAVCYAVNVVIVTSSQGQSITGFSRGKLLPLVVDLLNLMLSSLKNVT